MRTIQDLLTRLRSEFLEMPCLCLTSEQVQHLCGIERTICQMVLDTLIDERFLCLTPDGRYACVTSGPRPVQAKAYIRIDTRANAGQRARLDAAQGQQARGLPAPFPR